MTRARPFEARSGSCSTARHVVVHRCRSTANGGGRRVAVGDVVQIRFTCRRMDGESPEEAWAQDVPLKFEVGGGDFVGNKIFQGIDEAVRGMSLGECVTLETAGSEWNPDLLFKVPVTHPEIERLQGRYRNQGGLQKGIVVELVNKELAWVVEVDEEHVVLDANSMVAGKKFEFEVCVDDFIREPTA